MVVKRKKQQLQSAAASGGGREGEVGVVQTRPQPQLSSAESQPPATAPQLLHPFGSMQQCLPWDNQFYYEITKFIK